MMVISGAVTKRVDRLEREGLVQRTVNDVDARGRVIALTSAGRSLVARVHPLLLANEDGLLGALDPVERTQLAGLLRRLLISLKEDSPRRSAGKIGRGTCRTSRTIAMSGL